MIDKINDVGPAFPLITDESKYIHDAGMTLRDYFAAKAMQAYLTHAKAADSPEIVVAAWAYTMADAMLKVRG